VKITDDNGRLKKILKKSEWNSSKISLRIRREFFILNLFLNQSSLSSLISCSLCKIFFSDTNRFWSNFY
jgi:hypothetical protein